MLDEVLSTTTIFDALFINRSKFLLGSDQLVKISLDADRVKNISSKIGENSPPFEVDRLGDVINVVSSRVVSVLSEGLGERVALISVSKENVTWDFGVSLSGENQDLILGFRVNPRQSVALLTKGPPADSEEAAKFREFWGDLSSLRRFRDSTFHEAVLWMENGVPVGDRRLILGKIVQCIMKQHFGVPSKNVQYIASQLEDLLRPRVLIAQENFKYGTGEELISSTIISFDNLAKKLRSLELPLQVTSVQSTSDVLKHAIVFPPLPTRVPRPFVQNESKRLKTNDYQTVSEENIRSPFYRPAINVQIFLEISGKWPDDLVAIKSIKQEFLQKISELLGKDGITCVVLPSCVLVVWEGYVFNIQICYRREIYLLKSLDTVVVSETGRHDAEASFSLEKEIEILPKLTSSLNSLQSEYLCFSGSIRLVRRWVSSQLLIPHFPHIVIDIIVAYLFLNPYPYSPPNTPHVSLLRFMKLMASTNWKCTPLFVNLRSELTVNDEDQLTSRFTNSRSFFPPLFICTPCELRPLPDVSDPTPDDWNKRLKYASCWSRTNPSLVILGRMKVVAEAALKVFESCLWKKNFDFKALFRPQMTDYNAVIYLKETLISRRLENVDNKEEMCFDSYTHSKGELLPVTNFDPVQLYLRELREAFSNDALFFHDEHGGTAIGVLWKPHVFEEKEPK
ncbi:Nucleolar protein 6, partial [Armadillidium vulgare]